MAKDPHFPFYAQDFLVDTIQLDEHLTGAYIRMLSVMWINGFCLSDAMALAKISPSAPKVAEVLKDKFTFHENGTMTSNRLETERAKRIEIREKRSFSGRLGYKQKQSKHPSKNQAKDNDKDNDNDKEINTIEPSEFDFEIADLFVARARDNFKTVKPDRLEFAHSVRLLRGDGLTEGMIRKIAEHLKTRPAVSGDKFCWFNQIGTPGKLRKRTTDGQFLIWEKVIQEMNAKPKTDKQLAEEFSNG